MKFTLSWLKDHLETEASLDEIVAVLTRVGLEVEAVEDKALALKPFTIASRHRGEAASERRSAARLRRRHRRRLSGAGGLRCAQCAHRHDGRVLSARKLYSRQEDHARQGRDPRRRIRTACSCSEAELEISDDHDGIIELPARRAGRRALTLPTPGSTTRSSRSPHAEPAGRRLRRTASRETSPPPGSAGSRRRRSRRSRAVFPVPCRCISILPPPMRSCARPSPSARARRDQCGPSPALMQKQAQGDRASADQRARRHHQLHDLRPRTAACTCSTRRRSRARSRCAAPRKARRSSRSTARPTRSTRAWW